MAQINGPSKWLKQMQTALLKTIIVKNTQNFKTINDFKIK